MKVSVELYTLSERFGDYRAVEMAKEAGFDIVVHSISVPKGIDFEAV